MTTELSDMTATVTDALLEVAPDVDPATLGPDALLREDLELDSMDILNLVVALKDTTGIDVPEQDYGELTTVATIARYLRTRVGARGDGE
jgi:acyl carrier protein